ncbi:MAG: M48 family metallopeptidase [Proteobacteria bacterium]|nr:M48 family metallopeptidase [Pseudomonadota bacterium]
MHIRTLAALASAALIAAACVKVPYTGRKQLNVIPDKLMNGLGKQSYSGMLQGVTVKKKGSESAVLTRVGREISRVANKPDFDWQFAMIEDPALNAWCLPGGYIGFYTGILPVLKNEAGMAFVMGHEVGHATARHGSERLSQNLAVMGGLAGINLILSGNKKMNDQQRGIVMGALGLGAQYGVMLPFSRAHETEADVIGTMYMANAGYPPAEGIKVWERMAEQAGAQPPEFMSTHPAHDRRQANIREWLPQARKRYERNRIDRDTLETLWGR